MQFGSLWRCASFMARCVIWCKYAVFLSWCKQMGFSFICVLSSSGFVLWKLQRWQVPCQLYSVCKLIQFTLAQIATTCHFSQWHYYTQIHNYWTPLQRNLVNVQFVYTKISRPEQWDNECCAKWYQNFYNMYCLSRVISASVWHHGMEWSGSQAVAHPYVCMCQSERWTL